MKLPRLKTVLLTPLVLLALFYAVGVAMFLLDDRTVEPLTESPAPITVAIFGASGTAGDGILKAALVSPDIEKIHVITRRVTPRMEEGVASGKAQVTLHTDYLDYSAVVEQLADVDAVYWAIGISSLGVDEKTYRMIHIEFPIEFITAWRTASDRTGVSFHYISSSDISADSSAMWARVKVEAEEAIFEFARRSKLRAIAYRPLYWFFAPVGAAVKATQIGQTMIEVTARPDEFENGDKIGTWKIIRYSDAYEVRQ